MRIEEAIAEVYRGAHITREYDLMRAVYRFVVDGWFHISIREVDLVRHDWNLSALFDERLRPMAFLRTTCHDHA